MTNAACRSGSSAAARAAITSLISITAIHRPSCEPKRKPAFARFKRAGFAPLLICPAFIPTGQRTACAKCTRKSRQQARTSNDLAQLPQPPHAPPMPPHGYAALLLVHAVRQRIRKAPSQRYNRVAAAFYAGEAPTEADMRPTVKRGPQPEGKVNKTGQEWARLRDGELYRNRRGLAGYMPPNIPVGLGPNGAGDLVGPITILITPAMVGRRMAIYSEFESKTDEGVLEPHQISRIEYLRDKGAMAGC